MPPAKPRAIISGRSGASLSAPPPAAVSAAEYRALLDTAHAVADAAGEVLRPRFRRRMAVENKARPGSASATAANRTFDPVTAADKAAERAILKALKSRHPDHGVLGEEYGAARPDARFQWVIDPIDGTRSFISGMPTWGTLIGLNDGGRPLLGMMDQPYTGERAWADRAASQFRSANGTVQRMKTRACPALSQAIVMTTTPDMFADGPERSAYLDLKAATRMIRFGGDCYAYCMLALGHVDLVVEAGLQPYDIVALIPIIERAGGRVTTWDGGPAAGGGRILASGDARVHEVVLERLRKVGM